MKDKTAPRPGCICAVCLWANRRIQREAWAEEDLRLNYEKYLAGELVSKDDRD